MATHRHFISRDEAGIRHAVLCAHRAELACAISGRDHHRIAAAVAGTDQIRY